MSFCCHCGDRKTERCLDKDQLCVKCREAGNGRDDTENGEETAVQGAIGGDFWKRWIRYLIRNLRSLKKS